MEGEDVAQKIISKAISNVQKNPPQVKGWMCHRHVVSTLYKEMEKAKRCVEFAIRSLVYKS